MSAVSSGVAADREAFASVAGTLDANVGDIVAQFLNAKSEHDAKFTEPPAEVYAQHALERVDMSYVFIVMDERRLLLKTILSGDVVLIFDGVGPFAVFDPRDALRGA